MRIKGNHLYKALTGHGKSSNSGSSWRRKIYEYVQFSRSISGHIHPLKIVQLYIVLWCSPSLGKSADKMVGWNS